MGATGIFSRSFVFSALAGSVNIPGNCLFLSAGNLMSIWHVILYVVVSILALRMFLQLAVNYRREYQQKAVEQELIKLRDKAASADRPTDSETKTAR